MRNSNDELGNRGEAYFELLSSEEPGVVCNPSKRDRTGWDFVLEWPESASSLPRDLRRLTPAAFIQVKATSRKSNTVAIKLSNLEKMLKSKSPCFLVLFRFTGKTGQPTECFVMHVWEALLEQTAERLTKEDKVGNEKLHKKSISVKFLPEHRVENEELIQRIRSYIDQHGSDYAAVKSRFAYLSGDMSMKAFVRFGSGVTAKAIAEHSVGLSKNLPVERFQPVSVRFGIEREMPGMLEEGLLTFEPKPHSKGMLVLKDSNNLAAQDSVELFTSLDLGGLADEDRILRIQGNYLSAITRPYSDKSETLTFALTPHKQHSLDEIKAFLVASEVMEAECVDWTLYVEGQALAHGAIDMSGVKRSDPDYMHQLKQFFDRLEELVPNYLHPQELGFTLQEIEAMHKSITITNQFLGGHQLIIAGTGDFEPPEDVFRGIMPFIIPLPRYWLSGAMEAKLTRIDDDDLGACFRISTFEPHLWELTEEESGQMGYDRVSQNLFERIASFQSDCDDGEMPFVSFSQTFPEIEGIEQAVAPEESVDL